MTCSLCDRPLNTDEPTVDLNGLPVHLYCYRVWSEDQAKLRQKEEDEL